MIQILILTTNDLCSFIIFYYLSHHKRKFGENSKYCRGREAHNIDKYTTTVLEPLGIINFIDLIMNCI